MKILMALLPNHDYSIDKFKTVTKNVNNFNYCCKCNLYKF